MKILSNFDTGLEKSLIADYAKQFGTDRVLSIRKSSFIYYRHIVWPIVTFFVLLIVSLYATLMIEHNYDWLIWLVSLVFLLYGFALGLTVFRRRMDYRMDFLIVTPKEIAKYDQSGVFNKKVERIHTDKIKSITITKPGFFNSMFDIGNITFLAEGESDKGDIVMNFIDAVEEQERKIRHVMGMDGD